MCYLFQEPFMPEQSQNSYIDMKKLVRLISRKRLVNSPRFCFGQENSSRKNWQGLMKKRGKYMYDLHRSLQSEWNFQNLLKYAQQAHIQLPAEQIVELCSHLQAAVLKKQFKGVNNILTMKVLDLIDNNNIEALMKVWQPLYFTAQKIREDLGIHDALAIVCKMLFDKLRPLEKEMAVYYCLKRNFANRDMLLKHLQEQMKQPTYEAMLHPNEVAYYLFLRITNTAYFQDYLSDTQFREYFNYDIYEQMIEKVSIRDTQYLKIIGNYNHLLKLKVMHVIQGRPYMVYKLPYTYLVKITKPIKERLAKLWGSLYESVNIYHDFRISMSLFMIFNPSDRYLLTNLFKNMINYPFSDFKHLNLKMLSAFKYQHKCFMYVWVNDLKKKIVQGWDDRPDELINQFLVLYNLGIEEILDKQTSDSVKIKYSAVKRTACALISQMMLKYTIKLYDHACSTEDCPLPYSEGAIDSISDALQTVIQPTEDPKPVQQNLIGIKEQIDQYYDEVTPQAVDIRMKLLKKLVPYHQMRPIFSMQNKRYLINRILNLSSFLQYVALLCRIRNPSEKYMLTFINNLNTPEGVKAIKNYICLPGVLDSLHIINNKANECLSRSIFGESLKSIIDEATKVFENTLTNIASTCAQITQKNPSFKPDILYKQGADFLFTVPAPIFTQICNKSIGESMFDKDTKDVITQRFSLTQENVLNNLYSNQIARYCIQVSELKEMVDGYLKNFKSNHRDITIKKNVITYPYFADFLIETNKKKKMAVFCLDYSKQYYGIDTPNKTHQAIIQSMKYFRDRKWNILQVKYSDLSSSQNLVKPRILVHLEDILLK